VLHIGTIGAAGDRRFRSLPLAPLVLVRLGVQRSFVHADELDLQRVGAEAPEVEAAGVVLVGVLEGHAGAVA
jgi:hypothetical protein